MLTNLQRPDCRPFAWARNSLLPVPGAYAPGFMLAPAPQAKSRFFVQGRLKAKHGRYNCHPPGRLAEHLVCGKGVASRLAARLHAWSDRSRDPAARDTHGPRDDHGKR